MRSTTRTPETHPGSSHPVSFLSDSNTRAEVTKSGCIFHNNRKPIMPTQSTSLGGYIAGHHLGEGRHYVDPWDLENYAYLRRHSIHQFSRQLTSSSSSLSSLSSQSRRTSIYDCFPHSYGQRRQRRQAEYLIGSYRYIPLKGDSANAVYGDVDKLYDCYDVDELSETLRAEAAVEATAEQIVRQHHGLYHTRRDDALSIYDDETIEANAESLPIHYASPPERRSGSFQRNGRFDREERECGTKCAAIVMGDKDALSRKFHTELRRPPSPSNDLEKRYSSNIAVSENERMDIYLTKPYTPSFLQPLQRTDLNTCGHLKIDYTDSWNSLNRKINKEERGPN